MVLHDPQAIGGLEEYAATLAIGLQQRGHPTSVLSDTWVASGNQYIQRLRANQVPYIQLPKWISYPASHWPTKEKILAAIMVGLTPLAYLLGAVSFILRKKSWERSLTSARGWVNGLISYQLITPDRRKPFAALLLFWWRLRWRPDLLHIQGYTQNLLYVIEWAHKKGLPVVYEEHQTPDAQFDWWQDFHQSVNKANVVVAVSEKSAQALRTVCGVTRPIIVRPPLLPDPLASGSHEAFGQDFGPLPENQSLVITAVARLEVPKGLRYLLEAIAHIRQSHPTLKFRVYGDGSLRQELIDYAGQLGLEGKEIFAGAFTQRDELARIMAQTGIYVLPSILEGQPLSLVEAMAFGCPIIATSVGGIPELIQDGVNGLLCEPHDAECLADKICTLIEDPELRSRLGRAARKSYEQGPFQPAAVCEHLIPIYEKALVLQPPGFKLP